MTQSWVNLTLFVKSAESWLNSGLLLTPMDLFPGHV